uniref:TOBE domain-containing protein n=1 Tax=Desulfobacter sp. TaxID=2294 RepID=UPI00257B1D69
WHLVRLDFAGGSLWTRDFGFPVGRKLRIRVLARDVGLSRQRPEQTSIQNILAGRVTVIADDEHPGLALARIEVGASVVTARLAKRAVAAMELTPGQEVWVQVKSVSLIE